MNNISIDDLRNLAGQMKLGNGDIEDNTVFHIYGDAISVLTDLWNYAHELGHDDERACAEAERNAESEAQPKGYTFAEVVKTRNRMCTGTDCEKCPLKNGWCYKISTLYTDESIAEFERAVMDWAKQNPEMRYPTWREWRNENFPASSTIFSPCNFDIHVECDGKCDSCADAEIPESIAVKLGIQKRPK